MEMYESYEGYHELLERCLNDLENPQNENEVVNVLSQLNSDIIYDEPTEIIVYKELIDLGEEEIAKTYIYPLISELGEEFNE